ncbi:MAG: hypothetical protein QOE61_340 [Micromonosporaceae bacterium]|nr:hypothetical protein [Micromonosporaceae bacterium]
MVYRSLVPELGHLAWSPVAGVDGIEIFDRFNGVPTLGLVRVGDQSHLFWRAAFHTLPISVWLYLPVTDEERVRLQEADDVDLLDGLIFNAPCARYAAVSVADGNRIVFEREWSLPVHRGPEATLVDVIDFARDSLAIAVEQDPMPASRLLVVQQASRLVQELVTY